MGTTTKAASGSFGPVSDGPVRTDADFDLNNLSDDEREVVTADDFIIFGKASIEQWNDPAPGEEHLYIEMDALEEQIDQLLALDNLSRRHDDVKVGEFLDEYTLDESTTVHLDNDETLRFDAGDTLRTQVVREGETLPDGSGTAQEDALWIVANVYGRGTKGSVISQETRLGAYYGHLDGFSVTVYTREYEQADKGKVAREVDFLAVTIGEDELIKNKGSHFGVAEFQARFADAVSQSDDAGMRSSGSVTGSETVEALGRSLEQRFTMGIFNHLFSQSKTGLVGETIAVAQQSEQTIEEAATDVVDGEDADHIAQQAEERLDQLSETLQQEEMDRDDLANEVADELGMDKEEVHALFNELEAAVAEEADEPDDDPADDEPGDDEDAGTDEQGLDEGAVRDLIQQEVPDAVGSAIEEQLGDLETQSDDGGDAEYVTKEEFDDRLSTLSQQLETAVEGIGESVADNIAKQMQTAETGDPAGGSATAESDMKDEVEGVVDSMTFGDSGGN
ncbi:hypothetical protein [Haloarcula pellucida]|uniref:Uncharacterized protein n=1 Tax=Haloarcula pellucida TaxID=1427151 RepID=A0A830GS97_9EURY|nr:hypothetical protein [Halomicroarcula pellucida]MBX0350483.1 hypothetical protein [Halomicroarcula pellucida]GGO03534.1 hypothetical protein GCM10009030_39290 [Halomicroarcula pellucida]